MKAIHILKRLLLEKRATALIEFAIILPVLFVLLFGILEITRAILIHQKVDKVVHAMADFTTQSERSCVQRNELNAFNLAAERIMSPFDFSSSTTIIFNSIGASVSQPPICAGFPSQPCLLWSHTSIGGAPTRLSLDPAANIVNVSTQSSFDLDPGRGAIVTEMIYNFEPLLDISNNFLGFLGSTDIYRAAIYTPRTTSLTTLMNACPPPGP